MNILSLRWILEFLSNRCILQNSFKFSFILFISLFCLNWFWENSTAKFSADWFPRHLHWGLCLSRVVLVFSNTDDSWLWGYLWVSPIAGGVGGSAWLSVPRHGSSPYSFWSMAPLCSWIVSHSVLVFLFLDFSVLDMTCRLPAVQDEDFTPFLTHACMDPQETHACRLLPSSIFPLESYGNPGY